MNTILLELTSREAELVLLGINMAVDTAKAMIEEAGGVKKAPTPLLTGTALLMTDAISLRSKIASACKEKIERGDKSVEMN